MRRARPLLDDMLDQLIASPSVSSVDPSLDTGNRAVNELLAGWLEVLDFEIQLQDIPGHTDKCNLVATRGEGTGGLVLAGHTDTVPWDEQSWRRDPFVAHREDGRLYGLGSSDMKGFFALVVEALQDKDLTSLQAPLSIVATADEESGMAGARALAAAELLRGSFVVIGEPTGLRPVRSHKGIFMLRIILTGRSGHSSDPALGRSALEGMQHLIWELLALRARLQEQYSDARFAVPVPTLNLGRIAGGDNPNRICARCELDVDLRLTPGMELDDARERLMQTARQSAVKSGLKVTFRSLFDGVAPMDTAADSRLVQYCEELTGQPSGYVSFATEAPYFDRMGLESVVLGPGDIAVAHQPDEYLELARARPMIGYLRNLVGEFCMRTQA